MSRYHWQVTGIERNPNSTLVRKFEDEGVIEAEHVGHVVELLSGVQSVIDWSMVEDYEVDITIKKIEGGEEE